MNERASRPPARNLVGQFMKTTIRDLQTKLAQENTGNISDYVIVDVYDGDESDVIDIEVDHETKQVRFCVN